MEREYLSPVTSEDGEPILQPGADLLNDDWMRAARLQRRAKQGDEEAQRELERMQNTAMTRPIQNE